MDTLDQIALSAAVLLGIYALSCLVAAWFFPASKRKLFYMPFSYAQRHSLSRRARTVDSMFAMSVAMWVALGVTDHRTSSLLFAGAAICFGAIGAALNVRRRHA